MGPCRVGPQTGRVHDIPLRNGAYNPKFGLNELNLPGPSRRFRVGNLKGCDFYALVVDLPPHAGFRSSPVPTRKVDSHKPKELRGTQG
jgi:hypothetical protein